MRKPSLHQQPGRRELRCERHRPVQPIQDSNGERGAGADEPLRIHVELPAYGMATDSSPSETITQ